MGSTDQKGFTIIETSLFLAVSALLFVTLFSGVSLAVQRQRYTDSVQSTHSFLQKQFNETLNVVNNREADPCPPADSEIGASNCVVMGKAIQFPTFSSADNKEAIKIFNIIGEEPTSLPAGQEPTIADYKPRLIQDNNQEEFLIPWGAEITGSALIKGHSKSGRNTVALIRSPESGATFVYALYLSSNPLETTVLNSTSLISEGRLIPSNQVSTTQPVRFCLKSEDITNAKALIEFNGTGSQDGVTVKFDAPGNERCDLVATPGA